MRTSQKYFLTRIFILKAFLLLSGILFAQKESNIWYFGGYAGLDFNTNPPTALTNGALGTLEGCASIADNNGNILFYTDGDTVWNRKHLPMPNGFALMGFWSVFAWTSTQAAIILPKTCNTYYVFTVDGETDHGAFRYSIVDMTLDGGRGDVSIKNRVIHEPVCEKLTIVKHANGKDVWVVIHEFNTNEFLAYLVNDSLNSSNPVHSPVGTIHTAVYGDIKASPDTKKIAVAIQDIASYEVFDFDNATGKITKPIKFPKAHFYSYNLEFSPDGSRIYVNGKNNSNGIDELYQYDLLAGSNANINASGIRIKMDIKHIGALQLGPDGKIYVARQDVGYLGIINNPNSLGLACNYVEAGVFLGGKRSTSGLPQKIQRANFTSPNLTVSPNDTICPGEHFSLSATGANTYGWWPFSELNSSSGSRVITSPEINTSYTVIDRKSVV